MSTKDTRHVKWNDDSASDRSIELNASSKGKSPATKSNGTNPKNPVANSMPLQSVSFDNDTLSGYQADRESDTEDIPRSFPAMDGFVTIPKFLPRTERDKNIDSGASQWLKQSSMTTGESDVESVESINSGLGDAAQETRDRSHSMEDEEFLDLSSEKDLQTKVERLWEQVRSIQAILDQAQVSDNPAVNQEIFSQIQTHALEIAGIFGDDFRELNKLTKKLESEVSDLKSTNRSQRQQRDKLAADLARAHGAVMEFNRNASELRQQISKARDKTTDVEYELENAKIERLETIKQAMKAIEKTELAAKAANQEEKDNHQVEVSQLKTHIEGMHRLYSFEQYKNQKELLSQSNKRIATEKELKEQKLRSEQISILYGALQKQYRTLQQTAQEGNSKYRDLEVKCKETNKELAIAQKEVGNLQFDLHITRQQVLSGQRMHEREKKVVSRNHVALAASYSEKMMQLEALQTNLESKVREVCTSNKSLKEENEDLSAQVQSLKATCTAVRDELESCKPGNRPSNKRIAAMLAENEKLKPQVEGLEGDAINKTGASGQQLSSQTESVDRMPQMQEVLRELHKVKIENMNLKNEEANAKLQIEEQKTQLNALAFGLESEAYPLLDKLDADLTSALAQLDQERSAHLACAQKLVEAEEKCAVEVRRLDEVKIRYHALVQGVVEEKNSPSD